MGAVLKLQTFGALRLSGPKGELLPRRHKELALLVLLAHSAPRAMRREELQTLLWGDRPPEKARHSLRQALLQLRRACGDAIEAAADVVRLSDGVLFYDARAFSDAAAESRFGDAVTLATGEFLVGCDDLGTSDFRLWLDLERDRLKRLLDQCFERGAKQLEALNDQPALLDWSRRWSEQFPLHEQAQLQYIQVLCAIGDVIEAEAVRARLVRRLAQELDDEPAAAWVESVEQLINLAPQNKTPLSPAALQQHTIASNTSTRGPADAPAFTAPGKPARRTRMLLPAVVVAVMIATISWRAGFRGGDTDLPVIAVGRIEPIGVPDSAAAVPQLLAIQLGRASELRVISEARIAASFARLQSNGDGAADVQRAARAAGADELIEGVLARRADGSWQLDLRRIALESYTTRSAYRIISDDLLNAVDQATERIAHDLHVVLPGERFAGATTSIGAYRLYQEGLRAYHEGDLISARRLFRSALAEDSTFALAAHYAARASGLPDADELHEHAARMAQHASDHDRLTIVASWLAHQNAPAQLAVAETLAVRYPAEPDAHQEYGRALVAAGRFLEAVPHFKQVIFMDSLGLRGIQPRCLACDAYTAAANAYRFADSLPAAARLAEEWVDRQPGSMHAQLLLASIRASQSRYDEALYAVQAAQQVDANGMAATEAQPDIWLRMGDFTSTDRFWRSMLESGDVRRQMTALDIGISSLRLQGRFDAALTLALRQRRIAQTDFEKPIHEAYRHANVLFDLGRYRASGALFDSIAAVPFADSPSRNGRQRAWMLSQAATAYAAAGDIARLREIEGMVFTEGRKSAYRRDQLLHHYVRGLRLRAQGDIAGAAVEFRRSLYSPVEGNTRASLELARTLMQLGQAAAAIPVLRSALAGPIGASGQYANRAELEKLIASAYVHAGQPALAVPHNRWLHKAGEPAPKWLNGKRDPYETPPQQ